MKAAICEEYGPPDVLKIRDVPKPTVSKKSVLIRVKTSAVNASDIRIRALDAGPGARGAISALIMRVIVGINGPRKKILGSAVSGVIEDVGEEVANFKVGDEVFALTGLGFGGFAEYCAVPAKRAIALKPKKASFAEAVALPFGGSSALYFLRKAGVEQAKDVLIYGSTGAVGSSSVQVAKYYGAKVDAFCGYDGVELSKQLGASDVFDYKQTKLSELRGKYDIVFDAVGKISKKQARHLLKENGKYTTVAGLDVSSETSADLEQLGRMYDEGKLIAVIDKTCSLDEIVEAHKYVDTGRKKGNVIIEISK